MSNKIDMHHAAPMPSLGEVEQELSRYRERFCGKTILLPFDNPSQSNFVKFFVINFAHVDARAMIATSTLSFPGHHRGQIFSLVATNTIPQVSWEYLPGDGHFSSDEVMAIKQDADIIFCSPPPHLLPEFFPWLGDTEFSLYLPCGSAEEFSDYGSSHLAHQGSCKNNFCWLTSPGLLSD